MTVPARHLARGRTLQLIRTGYGMVLVLAPGPAIGLAAGRAPSRRTCRVAQVLGTRHLIQAALTAVAPRPEMFAIGGRVDAVHSASMLLAAVRPAEHRAALTYAGRGGPGRRGILGLSTSTFLSSDH